MGELIFGRKVSMFILGLILVQSFLALTAYISIFSAASASNISLPYLGTCDIYDNPSFLDLCRLNYGFFLALYLFIMIFFVLRGI